MHPLRSSIHLPISPLGFVLLTGFLIVTILLDHTSKIKIHRHRFQHEVGIVGLEFRL